MKLFIFILFMVFIGCTGKSEKQKDNVKANGAIGKENIVSNVRQATHPKLDCDAEVCLQLRNHNAASNTFDIFMLNAVPIAGFQCDLPGVVIDKSSGGLLEENGYQTSNSVSRILSFSMQAKLISAGEGILTTISYSEPKGEVCMTEIIFAGIGGSKLSNNQPDCLSLK